MGDDDGNDQMVPNGEGNEVHGLPESAVHIDKGCKGPYYELKIVIVESTRFKEVRHFGSVTNR
jgi:hypothetical protein